MQQRTFLLTVDIHCLLAHISESGYCPTTNSNYMVPSEKLMSNRFQGLYFTSKLCIHCPRASWDFSAFFFPKKRLFPLSSRSHGGGGESIIVGKK